MKNRRRRRRKMKNSAPKAPKNEKFGAEGAEKGGGVGGSDRICWGAVIWDDVLIQLKIMTFLLKISGGSIAFY